MPNHSHIEQQNPIEYRSRGVEYICPGSGITAASSREVRNKSLQEQRLDFGFSLAGLNTDSTLIIHILFNSCLSCIKDRWLPASFISSAAHSSISIIRPTRALPSSQKTRRLAIILSRLKLKICPYITIIALFAIASAQ